MSNMRSKYNVGSVRDTKLTPLIGSALRAVEAMPLDFRPGIREELIRLRELLEKHPDVEEILNLMNRLGLLTS